MATDTATDITDDPRKAMVAAVAKSKSRFEVVRVSVIDRDAATAALNEIAQSSGEQIVVGSRRGGAVRLVWGCSGTPLRGNWLVEIVDGGLHATGEQ